MDRKCEGCKWFGDGWVCGYRGGYFMRAVHARAFAGECGESGRYWEPREEKE